MLPEWAIFKRSWQHFFTKVAKIFGNILAILKTVFSSNTICFLGHLVFKNVLLLCWRLVTLSAFDMVHFFRENSFSFKGGSMTSLLVRSILPNKKIRVHLYVVKLPNPNQSNWRRAVQWYFHLQWVFSATSMLFIYQQTKRKQSRQRRVTWTVKPNTTKTDWLDKLLTDAEMIFSYVPPSLTFVGHYTLII